MHPLARLLLLLPLAAAGPDPERGRSLFQDGIAGATVLEARLPGLPGPPLRGAAAACGNCHGADAAGRREGGLSVPALAGDVLRRGRRGQRAPFDLPAFHRALAEGALPAGQAMGRAMPRFALDEAAAGDILAWLERAEDLPAPGVTAERIHLALPFLETARHRAAAMEARDVLAAALPERLHGRVIEVRLLPLPPGRADSPCGPPALAAAAAIGVGLDAAAAAALRRCLPLRLLPLADPLPDDLGPMQTPLRGVALALARHRAEEDGAMAVLASPDPPLAAAAREAAQAAAAPLHPCRAPLPEARRLLLLCTPVELRQVLPGAAGRHLLLPLDLAGGYREALSGARPATVVLGDPRGRPARPAPGSEAARLAGGAGWLLAEALREAGRAVTRERLRQAFEGLQAQPVGIPVKDCVRPAETPRAVQILRAPEDGQLRAEPLSCEGGR